MSGRRSVSRVRPRRAVATPEISPERIAREIDLDEVDPERMLEYLRSTVYLDDTILGPSGSGVPPQAAVADASTRALVNIEAMLQRLMAQGPCSLESLACPLSCTTMMLFLANLG
jgi:hypothetical protein